MLSDLRGLTCPADPAGKILESNIFATSNRRSTCFRSDEDTEAKPAKSVHRSGNKRVPIVTLLKGPGALCPVFLKWDALV
ncbi:hypothetical protein E2636_17495 [Paenisporosarcina antarctica]|uniref:Uncharacterized protein n=1 Tax=Paenisporosarcina antarctica TaxID=417367 RepID=A0A4P7A2F6_9BACL|nr:hypothetical protein E2636_17495 [Paenisporosarcina antarctica]